MIAPPRRAVTRFFIPMIDVLILLFCIFLLMPFVSAPEAKDDSSIGDATAQATELEQTTRELAIAKRRLAEMKAERTRLFDRYRVTVLEIDSGNGRLYQLDDAGVRKEIASAADAERFIQAERTRAGARDVGVLLLYPRELSGFPLQEQVEAYRKWFRTVPHAFDNPWSSRE